MHRKVLEKINPSQKDRKRYSAEFEEATESKRPSRDEITGKYSADSYSKIEIENFIEDIGKLSEEDLSEILEVETVRSMPDEDIEKLNDMPINDFEPIFNLKRDNNKLVRVRGNFPDEELLEGLNEVLENLGSNKRIFLYQDSKIVVLNDDERKSLEGKFGSRFRSI